MTTPSAKNAAMVADFHEHLLKSKRIMALCGAGLSAASGLPTFRGAGGLWRSHDATKLATPGAWRNDSGLVWQFYGYRRHMALQVKPNAAHYALAQLARKKDFQCLSQNVDGLSQRAEHPRERLQLLHGTLFEVKCDKDCGYKREDFEHPFCPALALPTEQDPTTKAAGDLSNAATPLQKVERKDLPKCPNCEGVLRPGVVWFGEALPRDTLSFVDDWIDEKPIDLIMVIGTGAKVWPAAGYVNQARSMGTRVAVINMDSEDKPPGRWTKKDWMFQGDASEIVPLLLKPVVGDVTGS